MAYDNYIFDSTGGCAKCDAIDYYNREKPQRPHPFCDCIVSESRSHNCYTINFLDEDSEGSYNKKVIGSGQMEVNYIMTFIGTISCNGETHSSSITISDTVTMDNDGPEERISLDTMDLISIMAMDQAHMKVTDEAEALCDCACC